MILRLALRDLRGGLTGLRLLAVCLFLGVAALAGVGSLTSAVLDGLAGQGQAILGGDIQVEMNQREATPEELAAFRAAGEISHFTRMRAMATPALGGDPVLVELKGVDSLYPLYGDFSLRPGARARRPSGNQVAIGPELAERLGIGVGDALRIGDTELRVIGVIAHEPDRVSQGFALGPTAMVDRAGLAATGLVQPGSLYISAYRIRIPADADPVGISRGLDQEFPAAGLKVENRLNAAPGTRRFLDRLGQFLTLVGLSALIVAGIGVGNGVASYLDGKRQGIAMLKTLGAASSTIFLIYLIQIAIVAAAALLAGLAAGALVPTVVSALAGDLLPVPPKDGLYPFPLLLAGAYGLLAALAFALIPLARARTIPAASLLRGGVSGYRRAPLWAYAASLLAGATIAAIAILTAPERMFAAGFILACLALLLLLALLGWLVRRAVALVPKPRSPLLRLALANLHRPGAPTSRLVVALGLGLTLVTTLAVIETNLSGQIRSTIPARAPNFFLLDVPSGGLADLRAVAAQAAPGARLDLMPTLRGTVTAVGDRRIADMTELPEGAWFLRGDRSFSFAAAPPPGSRIVEGYWWSADYRGDPLVSLDAENARAAGLGVGDTITVSVLGRELTGRIANLREVDWSRMGVNFVVIFSAGTFEGAPHSLMGTAHMAREQETAFARAVNRRFPSVSAVRIQDVVADVARIMDQLAAAVRAAGAVAILAGIAVLIGALAASRRARIYDSVVLKLLGATRSRILFMQAIEFGLLALILAILALALGAGAGWYVVVELFELPWAPDWGAVLGTLAAGAGLTLLLGLAGSLPALAARPAQALRQL
ncbi:MAG: FtsX-like permease family protein [Alphaproteobacteria bacterium]|jgi:putative ABC transport system permease protein|nr:FtsX-like permease family protein [Alphaproteobacteria bacterium]